MSRGKPQVLAEIGRNGEVQAHVEASDHGAEAKGLVACTISAPALGRLEALLAEPYGAGVHRRESLKRRGAHSHGALVHADFVARLLAHA